MARFKKLNYQESASHKGMSITHCPLEKQSAYSKVLIRVGSIACQFCKDFKGMSHKKMTVNCGGKDERTANIRQ